MPLVVSFALLGASFPAGAEEPRAFLDRSRYHLGIAGEPEWEEFAGRTPHGPRLDLRFTARANAEEWTIFIRQENVKEEWDVLLNGRKLGRLVLQELLLVAALAVPPGALSGGDNLLAIARARAGAADDIVVGPIELDPRPRASAIGGAAASVEVVEAPEGRPLPCRLTVVDEGGALAPLSVSPAPGLAARPGVVYTADGRARISLRPGTYTFLASRGFEYGLDTREVSLSPGAELALRLEIRREVLTPGLAACDPHLHTLALSGHGDAGLEERAVTIAGEGIELAVATEHNSHHDYAEAAERAGVRRHFTPVAGNEVTTRRGHFNIFPVPPGSTPPDARIEDWNKLLPAIRSIPGVRVVILNHPRDVHSGFRPFGEAEFNPVSGETRDGRGFPVDALELVNSGALRSDLMEVYRDWFAILNSGRRLAGAGASDSHDVSRFQVGQARTYVACSDADPGSIDIDEACESFLRGRLLVSLGLLVEAVVDGRFGPGDTAVGLGGEIEVEVRVQGPSWVEADTLELYADGARIRHERLEPAGGGLKARRRWVLPRPAHDIYLVALASGPGVTSPHWAIPRPYQPSSRVWTPRVIGSTNPIWIDADGDGKHTSPREYARDIIAACGCDPAPLLRALAGHGEAVAAQAASICRAMGHDLRSEALRSALETASEPARRGFEAYTAALGR
jgi:hypothetical protein